MVTASDVAREVADAAAFVILAIIALAYGVRRILEELGVRRNPPAPESHPGGRPRDGVDGALANLQRLTDTLELSVRTIRDFGRRFDKIAGSMDGLTKAQEAWQGQLLERLERIERLVSGSTK